MTNRFAAFSIWFFVSIGLLSQATAEELSPPEQIARIIRNADHVRVLVRSDRDKLIEGYYFYPGAPFAAKIIELFALANYTEGKVDEKYPAIASPDVVYVQAFVGGKPGFTVAVFGYEFVAISKRKRPISIGISNVETFQERLLKLVVDSAKQGEITEFAEPILDFEGLLGAKIAE